MTSRRLQKAAEAVREVVGMAILADLKDPRIRNVTVTFVEVSPDMRQAKVHVSVMGSEKQQQLVLRGLQSAAGFLQSKVANRIGTRYTPRLIFVLDMGVKKSLEISQILNDVLPKEDEPAREHADEDDERRYEQLADEYEQEDDDEENDEHDQEENDNEPDRDR